MHKCVSEHGEYSDHSLDPDQDYVCSLCQELNVDALIDEVHSLRRIVAAASRILSGWQEVTPDKNHLRAGVEAIISNTLIFTGDEVRELLSQLLDRTSVEGER
jgi:hypothetical protein